MLRRAGRDAHGRGHGAGAVFTLPELWAGLGWAGQPVRRPWGAVPSSIHVLAELAPTAPVPVGAPAGSDAAVQGCSKKLLLAVGAEKCPVARGGGLARAAWRGPGAVSGHHRASAADRGHVRLGDVWLLQETIRLQPVSSAPGRAAGPGALLSQARVGWGQAALAPWWSGGPGSPAPGVTPGQRGEGLQE